MMTLMKLVIGYHSNDNNDNGSNNNMRNKEGIFESR